MKRFGNHEDDEHHEDQDGPIERPRRSKDFARRAAQLI